jgi:hypothetical protein
VEDYIADFDGEEALDELQVESLADGFKALVARLRSAAGAAPLVPSDDASGKKKKKAPKGDALITIDPALLAVFSRSVESSEDDLLSVVNILNEDSESGKLRMMPPAPSHDIFTFDEDQLNDFVEHISNVNLKGKNNGWVNVAGAKQSGKSSFILAALHVVDSVSHN